MDGSDPIDFNADVIDSRDIIARIEWLGTDYDPDADEARELAVLRTLAEEAEDITSEWADGEALVAARYFKDYIVDLMMETHTEVHEPGRPSWDPRSVRVDWSVFPFNSIDWDKVAEDERHGYSSVEVDGRTFWLRDA